MRAQEQDKDVDSVQRAIGGPAEGVMVWERNDGDVNRTGGARMERNGEISVAFRVWKSVRAAFLGVSERDLFLGFCYEQLGRW